MNPLRPTLSATAALALGATLALGAPLAASAHVGLVVDTADPGTSPVITFTVPNESDTLNTTLLTVDLPTDTPFVSVRPVAMPGWSAEVVIEPLPEPVEIGGTTITEAATSIRWTATDGGFGGHDLGLFAVRLGPVPDVDSIDLPAVQGYSDSSTVPWSGDESPVLFVNAAPTDAHGDSGSDEHADEASGQAEEQTGLDGVTVAAIVLGSAGFLLGAVALTLTLIRARSARPEI
jgi:uncharacterized protein YcnI